MPAGNGLSRRAKALLLSPAIILFASAVRLLVMANYDTTTATTIAAAGGVGGTLLGTVIPLLPPFLPALVLFLFVTRRLVLLVLTAGATAIVSPAYTAIPNALHAAIKSSQLVYRLFLKHHYATLWANWKILIILCGLAAAVTAWDPPPILIADTEILGVDIFIVLLRFIFALLIFAAAGFSLFFTKTLYHVPHDMKTASEIMRRPWVPAEQITTKSGEVRLGYTLTTKDGWHVFLKEDDRTIEYIPADSVVSRKVCSLKAVRDITRPPLLKLEGAHYVSVNSCH